MTIREALAIWVSASLSAFREEEGVKEGLGLEAGWVLDEVDEEGEGEDEEVELDVEVEAYRQACAGVAIRLEDRETRMALRIGEMADERGEEDEHVEYEDDEEGMEEAMAMDRDS